MKKIDQVPFQSPASSFSWPRASELAYAVASALGPYLLAGLLLLALGNA